MGEPARVHRADWLPISDWLPRYQRSWLRPDLIAAVTVWALVVPQAIAYAQIAGLPPQAGLFAAAAGLFAYALLGTARQLIVSPTSSTAAISASLVGAVALGDVSRFASLSSALAICCGVAFVVLGLARLGFISRFIPTAVQVGFMFGLGMTIIIGQTTKLLGVPGIEGSFVDQVGQLAGLLSQTNVWALAIGVVALAALLIGGRYLPLVPMALIVVIGGVIAVALLGLGDKGVTVIGLIDGQVPLPAIPAISPGDLVVLVPGAVAIAVMGSAESLTVAQQFAEEHRYDIEPDQELIANGGANVLSGFFQGFIVGGGASQSAAADRAGARTLLTSLIVSALTVATCIALLPLFQDLPDAVLGAIVIAAVLNFLRVGELRRIGRLRRDSFALALTALFAVLVLGILPGLIVAVVLALLVVLTRLARPRVTTIAADRPGSPLVIRFDAPLLFLNAGLLQRRVREIAGAQPTPVTEVILDLSSTGDLDIESLDVLNRLADQLAASNARLTVMGLRKRPLALLTRAEEMGSAPRFRLIAPSDPGAADSG